MEKDLSCIKKVYLEIDSFCNRKCDWCFNKYGSRRGHHQMEEDLFLEILHQLNRNNFGYNNKKGENTSITLLGYNEPMSDINLLKRRVNQIKQILPGNIIIETSTNGDYLSNENLKELNLTRLLINDYDNKGMDYWRNRLDNELKCVIIDQCESSEIIQCIHRYIGLIICQCNWTKNRLIEDKAGVLTKEDVNEDIKWKDDLKERDFACRETEYFITIDHNGNVLPCCHMRADVEDHKEFILGNLHNETLNKIYYSKKAANFRKRMLDVEQFPNPCKYCRKDRLEYVSDDMILVNEGEYYEEI